MTTLSRTIAALTVASTSAMAEYTYEQDHYAMYVESNEYTNVLMSVRIHPENGCKPTLHYFEGVDVDYHHEDVIDFKLKVDGKSHWNVDDAAYQQDPASGEMVSTATSPRLLTEMRRGRTIRFQFPLSNGGYDYASFSLMGFSRALSQAQRACDSNSDFFL